MTDYSEREYIVRLRAPKGVAADTIVRNMRAILKRLLRTYGFRCVSIEPAKDTLTDLINHPPKTRKELRSRCYDSIRGKNPKSEETE